MTRVTREAVLAAVLAQHRLGPAGIHGVAHWERVRENGLLLAERTGARTDIVAVAKPTCRSAIGVKGSTSSSSEEPATTSSAFARADKHKTSKTIQDATSQRSEEKALMPRPW